MIHLSFFVGQLTGPEPGIFIDQNRRLNFHITSFCRFIEKKIDVTDRSGNNNPKYQERRNSFAGDNWEEIKKSADLKKFNSLPSKIGCTDCKDAAIEWIEISDGKNSKRVEFDYGKNVPEIQNLVDELRKMRESVQAK